MRGRLLVRPVLALGLAAVLAGLPVGAHASEPGVAGVERRLAAAEAAHLAAQERVDRLTDQAAGFAEQADRAAVRAQVLRARLLTEDRGILEWLVDLLTPGDPDAELADAAEATQRAAQDAVARAAEVLADARERAGRAEAAWSEALAELGPTDIGGASARKTVAQRTVVGGASARKAVAQRTVVGGVGGRQALR